jgi:hypothetical protein
MEYALVDCGANGGVCGDDMLVFEGIESFVDVSGLAGHKVNQLRIVTAQAFVTAHKGDAIATFHQMALLGKGNSILSFLLMEAYGVDINDQSCSLPGGKQRTLIDGYQLPLDFKNGIPYLRGRKPTETEISSYIIMTSDVDLNPKQYDITFDEIEQFHGTSQADFEHEHFDQYGEYRIGQLLPIVLYPKKIYLMHWNILKLLTLLITSLIHYVLTMFGVLMLLILATYSSFTELRIALPTLWLDAC